MINSKAKTAYRNQIRGCRHRGIGFRLTLEQWYGWWLINGIDKNVKHSHDGDSLCMCRVKDKGDYSIGNIYCATRKQNTIDAINNGCFESKPPVSAKTRAKMSASGLGRKASEETLAKMRIARRKRGAIKMTDEVSAQRNKKIGKAFKGMEFYNNGANMIRLKQGDEVPSGYVKGYLQVECPQCGAKGHQSTMKRWHFDKCRAGS